MDFVSRLAPQSISFIKQGWNKPSCESGEKWLVIL